MSQVDRRVNSRCPHGRGRKPVLVGIDHWLRLAFVEGFGLKLRVQRSSYQRDNEIMSPTPPRPPLLPTTNPDAPVRYFSRLDNAERCVRAGRPYKHYTKTIASMVQNIDLSL